MKRSILRLLVATLASLMLLGSVGCDEAKLVNGNNQESESTQEEPTDENENENDQTDADHAAMDEQGHGSTEEEQVLIEPGYMNGSWRAATGEQDEPAVYFDTFQDEGVPSVDGTYLMGFAVYENLDQESGEIETATFDGETLTVLWNPTTDRDEMFTLQATRVDENTLKGAITAKRNVDMNIPVTITRQTAPE